MTALGILVAAIVLFAIAHRFYAPIIERILGVDTNRKTPAHTMKDGIDYCPAKAPVLFGHHFASIAGAAPIVGPVIAVAYGWGPVALWIIIGGIFLGGVHDFAALIASVRHDGRSIGQVIEKNVGRSGKMMFLFFLWATLVLLISVFLVMVAKTFVSVPAAATSSVLFIFIALLFGIFLYKFKLPLGILSAIGIVFLAICMAAGWYFPISLGENSWAFILLIYMAIASVAPVWILLQPRDYLNSFLLYALIILAVIGTFFAQPEINLPLFITWDAPSLGPIFPILFVTVACGAISGFHSVVASGTTAKQLNKEDDARYVGYGAMLVESLLAILAVISVITLTQSDYAQKIGTEGPIALFSQGIGNVIHSLGISATHGTTFTALAVSAFVLTSLDTATRLARFAFQEFFSPKTGEPPSILNTSRYIGTLVTVALSAILALSGQWKIIWPIFGSANQLLAALALLAVTLWMMNRKRKTAIFVIPMIIMFLITLSALATLVWNNYFKGNYALAIVGTALFVLAFILVLEAAGSIKRMRNSSMVR